MKTTIKYTQWFVVSAVALILLVYLYAFNYVLHCDHKFTIAASAAGIAIFCVTAWCTALLIKAYPTTVAAKIYAICIATVTSAFSGYTYWKILIWMSQVAGNNIEYSSHFLWLLLVIPCVMNNWLANFLALEIKNEILEQKLALQSDASVLLREAELFKLRQQFQPHFLYNSLNSINALMILQPDKAQEMIGKLSDFLRNSVTRENEDAILLADELTYIQSYLDIESTRFGDRLQIILENDTLPDAMLPPFLLQPILENAIKYGIYGTTGKVTIAIYIKMSGAMLIFTVINPYDNSMQPARGTGFGLGSIRRRLYLLYARNDLLETTWDEQYFTTILKIPQHVNPVVKSAS